MLHSASVVSDQLAGDVTGTLRGEQEHRGIDFIGITDASQRHKLSDKRPSTLDDRLGHVSVEQSERDSIHTKSLLVLCPHC